MYRATFKAKVNIFPMNNPWLYVVLPDDITFEIKKHGLKGTHVFSRYPLKVKIENKEYTAKALPVKSVSGKNALFINIKKTVANSLCITAGSIVAFEVETM